MESRKFQVTSWWLERYKPWTKKQVQVLGNYWDIRKDRPKSDWFQKLCGTYITWGQRWSFEHEGAKTKKEYESWGKTVKKKRARVLGHHQRNALLHALRLERDRRSLLSIEERRAEDEAAEVERQCALAKFDGEIRRFQAPVQFNGYVQPEQHCDSRFVRWADFDFADTFFAGPSNVFALRDPRDRSVRYFHLDGVTMENEPALVLWCEELQRIGLRPEKMLVFSSRDEFEAEEHLARFIDLTRIKKRPVFNAWTSRMEFMLAQYRKRELRGRIVVRSKGTSNAVSP